MHGWAKLNVHDCTVEIFMLCFEESVRTSFLIYVFDSMLSLIVDIIF